MHMGMLLRWRERGFERALEREALLGSTKAR
jgi:hypothetical protein